MSDMQEHCSKCGKPHWNCFCDRMVKRPPGAAPCSASNDVVGGMARHIRELEIELNAAHAVLREMIDLNETTGDPDPEITDRAIALLPPARSPDAGATE